jgi:hypothetical protein
MTPKKYGWSHTEIEVPKVLKIVAYRGNYQLHLDFQPVCDLRSILRETVKVSLDLLITL